MTAFTLQTVFAGYMLFPMRYILLALLLLAFLACEVVREALIAILTGG